MGEHDRLFKQLLRAFFGPFLAAFAPDLHRVMVPGRIEFLDKELIHCRRGRVSSQVVDLVARVRLRRAAGSVLVHVEHQSFRDPGIGRRLLRYAVGLEEQEGLPVYPVLLTSYDRPFSPEPNRVSLRAGPRWVLSFGYQVVQLNRLDWRQFVEVENPLVMALLPWMRVAAGDRVRLKLRIFRRLASLSLEPEQRDFLGGFVDRYLDLSAEEVLEFQRELEQLGDANERAAVMNLMTSWERRGLAQGLEQGREQGRELGLEQGLARGRAEGRLAERRALVTRQLARRIGGLDAAAARRLNRLGFARLEELAEALLDFQSVADLRRWFERRR